MGHLCQQNFIKQIMQHIVLARKYRPKTFDDFYWQQGIIDILKNAIKTDKMPHAIILHGIRGMGKRRWPGSVNGIKLQRCKGFI